MSKSWKFLGKLYLPGCKKPILQPPLLFLACGRGERRPYAGGNGLKLSVLCHGGRRSRTVAQLRRLAAMVAVSFLRF